MRALVIDDSKGMRLVVGRALRQFGVTEVIEATDGEKGLEQLRRDARVDVVMVDWNMPVMDGISFVRAMRADSRFEKIRVVMVTTESEAERVEAAMTAGANGYVTKPFSEGTIRDSLEKLGFKGR